MGWLEPRSQSIFNFRFTFRFSAVRRLPTDSVSTRQSSVRRREWTPPDEDWENPSLDNRLSREWFLLSYQRRVTWRRVHCKFHQKKSLSIYLFGVFLVLSFDTVLNWTAKENQQRKRTHFTHCMWSCGRLIEFFPVWNENIWCSCSI